MDQEQKLKNVEMLKRSVQEWNQMALRVGSPDYTDLRGVDLRDMDLREAFLVDCDLQGADVTNADFRGADLRDVKLSGIIGLGTARFAGARLDPKQLPLLLAIISEEINTGND